MKLKYLIPALLLIAIVIFFPIRKTSGISGDGAVLTTDKEKIGDCTLSIEIQEITSLAVRYRKTFFFVVDGEQVCEFQSAYASETGGGLCSISQMYYDAQENRMASCALVYQEDLSYAVIYWNDRLYFITNGTQVPYSEIPLVIAGS